MSPLARSLLALAAAALLHAACAGPAGDSEAILHCDQILEGGHGNYTIHVEKFHIDQTDYVFDLPPSKCPPLGSKQVGTSVVGCDKFGPPPTLQWLDGGKRARVTCKWNAGQTCPQGLDIYVDQYCQRIVPPRP